MALPSERESLNRIAKLTEAANKRRKEQAKTPSGVNSDPSALKIESFEEAMNVAMTAIIGGPQHVAKDFASLQSISKSKDGLFSIIDTQRTVVESIQKTISDINTNIQSIADNLVGNSETSSEEQTTILLGISESIDELSEFLKGQDSKKVVYIGLSAEDSNVKDMLSSLQEFDMSSLDKIEQIVTELNKLNSIDLSKFKENIQVLDDDILKNLSTKFDGIKDLYENHVAGAAEAAAKGQHDLDVINKTNEDLNETIVEGKKPDKKQLDDAKVNYEGLASVVLAGALVMIIGALIISNFPEFPELALKFAAVFTLFMTAILTPLVIADMIATKYGSGDFEKFEAIADIVATLSFVMIIGALFMKIDDLAAKSLEFTKHLTIFLVATVGALSLVSYIGKPEVLKSVKDLGNLIVLSTLVMIIGALFMKIDGLAENAIMFGVTLGIFIAVIVGPIMLLSRFGGAKKLQQDFAGIADLVTTCTIVMMIGALFMLLDNGTFVANALKFGFTLGVFIGLVLLPFLLFKPLIGIGKDVLENVRKFVVTSTIIMMIGAMFVMLGGGKFIDASFEFAKKLFWFEALCILPTLMLKPLVQQGLKILRDITLFIMVSTIVMLIGAYLVLNKPMYILAAFGFAAIFVTFVTATLLPIIALSFLIDSGLAQLNKITLFIGVCAAVMLIGAKFMKDGYALDALLFTGVFTVYLVAMAGAMWILSNIKGLKKASVSAMLMGGAIAVLGFAFKILHKTVTETNPLIDFLTLLPALGLAAIVFGVLNAFALEIALGSLAAAAMGAALMVLSVSFGLMHKVTSSFDVVADALEMIKGIGLMSVLFGAIALLAIPIAIGSVAILAMSPAIIMLSADLLLMNVAAKKANELPDTKKATENIKSFFELTKSFPSLRESIKMTVLLAGARKPMSLLTEMVSIMAQAMSDIANLRIPTAWDKNGNPISYRDIKGSDFTNAGTNIKTIITTIGTAFSDIYKENPELFDTGEDSPVFTVLQASKEMGGVISSIAQGLQGYAKLMVPDKWDSKGNPIHFKAFDPAGAATGISTIISTLGNSILKFISDNPELVGYMEETRGGFLGLSKQESKFATVCVSGKMLGEMISGIAQGLSAYADLKVPIDWDNNGNPKKFKQLDKTDITKAGENIENILKTLSLAIYNVSQDKNFIELSKSKTLSKISDTTTAIMGVVDNVSSMVSSISEFKIPIGFDNSGNPTGYKKIDPDADIKESLKKILLAIPAAINEIITDDKAKSLFDKDSFDKFKLFISSTDEITAGISTSVNSINTSVKAIDGVSLNKENLFAVLDTLSEIRYKIIEFNSSGKNSDSALNLSAIDTADTASKSSKIVDELNILNSALEAFVNTATTASKIQGNEFDNLNSVIPNAENMSVDGISLYAKEVEETEKFVKVIDSVKVQNVAALTELFRQMSNLSEHLGNLDKFTTVLSEKLSTVLERLSEQIRGAQHTIKEADRIQRQRHELIDNSISKVQKMMESTLQVNVTSTTSGAETTTEVTEEQR